MIKIDKECREKLSKIVREAETVNSHVLKVQIREYIEVEENDSEKTVDQRIDYFRRVINVLLNAVDFNQLPYIKKQIEKL